MIERILSSANVGRNEMPSAAPLIGSLRSVLLSVILLNVKLIKEHLETPFLQ